MVKILEATKYSFAKSYCRKCGNDTMVQRTYSVNNRLRRCLVCINKGCGHVLEIDGYPVGTEEEKIS